MPPVMLTAKVFPVPNEDGASITLRRLSGPERDEARRIKDERDRDAAVAIMAQFGDAVAAEAVASVSPEEREQRRAERAVTEADDTNPENFDFESVLRYGIVAWSYENEDGTPYPCDAETRVTLDPETAAWVVKTVLALSSRDPGNAPDSAK